MEEYRWALELGLPAFIVSLPIGLGLWALMSSRPDKDLEKYGRDLDKVKYNPDDPYRLS